MEEVLGPNMHLKNVGFGLNNFQKWRYWWRHHDVIMRQKNLYMAHARVQTIIFKTCGRSRYHLLYFSQYKRSKSGHFYTKSYHYYYIYIIIIYYIA